MKKLFIRTFLVFILVFVVICLFSLLFYNIAVNSEVGFFLYFGLINFTITMMIAVLYWYVNKKNNDIELSKGAYYFTKPYLIKITKKGIIKVFNKTIQTTVKDYQKYKSIFDLETHNESYDILEETNRQRPFTVTFESINGVVEYVRFLPLKTQLGYYLVGENITSQQKNYDYHRNMALYNNITKLPNKNFLGIKLQELFDDKQLLKNKNSLVAIDIIGFRNINKLFGYKIAEEALRELGKIIETTLNGYPGKIYNIESDNFMVLFNNLNKYQDVIDWTNQFLKYLEKPVNIKGNLFTIEVKIGVFHIEIDKSANLNPVIAYENAILTLKKAKGSRRLKTVVYDIALGQVFTRDQAMELDLVTAIKNHEMMMYLQPQYNNSTKRIVGFEALIRWNNPKYLYDSPSRFIELAEHNNLIVEIGRFVINESFKIAKELEPYDVRISINVSPVQILQTGFVHEIISAYEKFKLKRNTICLEITETFLMESLESVIDKLRQLKDQGFRIHLDNFGTGYSSMLYLKDLPIDAISINRDFIKNLTSDLNTKNIVSKIISLALSLNLEVIAEGVEDEKQNDFLAAHGCSVVQGHLISKAIPKTEAIALMLEYNTTKSKTTY